MPVYLTWACPVFVPNIAQPLLSGLDTGSVPSIKSHIRKNRVGGQTAGASKCRTLVGRVQHSAPRPTSLSMPSAIGISNRSCKADRTAPDCSPPAILTRRSTRCKPDEATELLRKGLPPGNETELCKLAARLGKSQNAARHRVFPQVSGAISITG